MLDNLPLLEAVIDHSASGDNVIIAGIADRAIRVYRIMFTVAADTTLTFKNGATALTGGLTMLKAGAVVLDAYDAGTPQPWFTMDVAADFIINLSPGVSIDGRVYYTQASP